MTMNTRQAGAFTELIHKEEASRARWEATHGARFAEIKKARATGNETQRGSTPNYNGNLGDTRARPQSARPSGRSTGATNAGYDGPQQAPGAGVTASGRPHAVFANALAVGTPRLVDQNDQHFMRPQTVTKKVIRQVEVPTTREVKVPIRVTKVVDVMVPRQVRSKKLIEVDALTAREEEYEDVQLIPTTRQREVLVKTYVTEPYDREVKVMKRRTVQVPVKKFKEIEEWHTIQCPEQQTVEEDGVRIDRVNETKLVEVEEYHTYELRPQPTGEAQVIGTKDIGTGRRLSGRVTGRVFASDDPSHAHLTHDSQSQMSSRQRPSSAGPQRNVPRSNAPPPEQYSQRYRPQSGVSSDSKRLGFKVRTSTAAPNMCTVFEVEPGQMAARGGLRIQDIVLSANGRQTNNMADFKNAVGASKGPLLLQVKRGADRLLVTIPR